MTDHESMHGAVITDAQLVLVDRLIMAALRQDAAAWQVTRTDIGECTDCWRTIAVTYVARLASRFMCCEASREQAVTAIADHIAKILDSSE